MKLFCSMIAVGVFALGCAATPRGDDAASAPSAGAVANPDPRPRVIVTSDFPPIDVVAGKGCTKEDSPDRCSDPDDVQSLVRLLLYSNELQIEALLASAGTFANIARKRHILDMLDRYDAVDEALRRHDPRFPSADHLRAITWQGMDDTIGTKNFGDGKDRPIESLLGPSHDTEASEAIIRVVDTPDPRPVWVCVWGGPRELAQAIWKVQHTRTPAELARFLGKLRVYLIVKQDNTADWLLQKFPDLFIILSERNYQGMFWTSGNFRPETANADWVERHLRQGHGPLGAAYPRSGWDPAVPGIWEGDSPSFLHILSGLRGINDPQRPDQAGWGGKFVCPDPTRNHWFDDPAGPETVYRWRPRVQEDFARRTEWMKL